MKSRVNKLESRVSKLESSFSKLESRVNSNMLKELIV